jgi:hypothetical protein
MIRRYKVLIEVDTEEVPYQKNSKVRYIGGYVDQIMTDATENARGLTLLEIDEVKIDEE